MSKSELHNAECINKFGDQYFCQVTGTKPSILIVGDSHLRLMWRYLRKQEELPSSYLVANDGSIIFEEVYPANKNSETGPAVKRVWEGLRKSPEIKTVVLRGYWGAYFSSKAKYFDRELSLSKTELKQLWGEVFQKLAGMDKKVIVILDNPILPEGLLNRCVPLQRLPLLPIDSDCSFSYQNVMRGHKVSKQILIEEAQKWQNVTLVDLDDVFCTNGICKAIKDGEPLYRDEHHLSEAGSALIWPVIKSTIREIN